MAVMVKMDIPGGTAAQYDAVISRLDTAGAGAPDGRLYHVAGPTDSGWMIVDVWDSLDSFNVFTQILIPITQEVSLPAFQPVVVPVYNVIRGAVTP